MSLSPSWLSVSSPTAQDRAYGPASEVHQKCNILELSNRDCFVLGLILNILGVRPRPDEQHEQESKQMVRNPVYQIAELRRYARAMGWSGALRLRFSDVLVRSGFSKPRFSRVKLKNSQFPLYMRAHTSDRDALSQVFIHGEYEIAQLSNPRTIIDLANVGYSAAYFLSKYPAATVLAVEPDAGNLEVCRRNLAPYGSRVKLVHGAAWPELVVEKGIYRDGRDWSTQVILFSPWGVVRKLKGSAWFPLGFVIFWYSFFLRMPATFGGMVAYEDFLLNAYFWLLLGVLFRLPTLALSAKFAADSPSAQREHRWIR